MNEYKSYVAKMIALMFFMLTSKTLGFDLNSVAFILIGLSIFAETICFIYDEKEKKEKEFLNKVINKVEKEHGYKISSARMIKNKKGKAEIEMVIDEEETPK